MASMIWLPVIALVLTVGACDRGTEPATTSDADPDASTFAPPTVTFDTATITFHTNDGAVSMHAEIADRQDRRTFGLMNRDELPPDDGMIFLYDEMQPAGSGFWMYSTRIPLDIAFFDGAGRIVEIQQMLPCPSPDPSRCEPYAARAPYFGAVEANRGYFARNGIGVGDKVVMPGRIGG